MKSLIILLAIFLSATHAFAQEPVWSKKYHTGSVTCLDFSGDGKMLASGGMDSTVKLWDIKNGEQKKNFEFGIESPSSLAWSKDQSKLVGIKIYYADIGWAGTFIIDLLSDSIITLYNLYPKNYSMKSPGSSYSFCIDDSLYFYNINSVVGGQTGPVIITGQHGHTGVFNKKKQNHTAN